MERHQSRNEREEKGKRGLGGLEVLLVNSATRSIYRTWRSLSRHIATIDVQNLYRYLLVSSRLFPLVVRQLTLGFPSQDERLHEKCLSP